MNYAALLKKAVPLVYLCASCANIRECGARNTHVFRACGVFLKPRACPEQAHYPSCTQACRYHGSEEAVAHGVAWVKSLRTTARAPHPPVTGRSSQMPYSKQYYRMTPDPKS